MDLPKFIVGDDGGTRDFIVHCHYPKFIMEINPDGIGKPVFIDSQSDYIANQLSSGQSPEMSMARLMREAADFFMENS